MNGTEPADPQWAEAEEWFVKADEDRQVAVMAIAAMPPLLNPAAYHCQQAVEKLLKGLLVTRSLPVPKTHDLAHLANLLAADFPLLHLAVSRLLGLSSWGVITRYPLLEASAGPDIDDVADALEQIAALQGTIETLRQSLAR